MLFKDILNLSDTPSFQFLVKLVVLSSVGRTELTHASINFLGGT